MRKEPLTKPVVAWLSRLRFRPAGRLHHKKCKGLSVKDPRYCSSSPLLAMLASRPTAASEPRTSTTSTSAPPVGDTPSHRIVPKSTLTATIIPSIARSPNWSGGFLSSFVIHSSFGIRHLSFHSLHSFNLSTAANTSFRRFSNTANRAKMAKPTRIPVAHLIHG